jgi:hypothetical protein
MLDAQVPPAHGDKLQALAAARRRKAPVDVVRLEGVNHLLVPATTGEVNEYPTLQEKEITPKAAEAIASWVTSTFTALRRR